MGKVNLKCFNAEVFASQTWAVFQEQWKINKYKEQTGKTAEEAYKFFGGTVPPK